MCVMEHSETTPEYVRHLRDPRVYPGNQDRVDVVETHVSRVFLAGDCAYKTKKEIRLDFVDQTQAATRESLCRAEVALNARLAPHVYLGVIPIVRMPDGNYVVDGDPAAGEVVEHAVKMRRLPPERTLENLLADDRAPADAVERLARTLIRFHEAAAIVANERQFAGAPAVRAWWDRECAAAANLVTPADKGGRGPALRAFIEETITREAPLFDERLAHGRVVEGHGDIRAEHVYLIESGDRAYAEATVIDCIEFSEDFHFRYLDVGYDIAFLAMDLEALGHAEQGDEVAGRYLAAAADETLGVLQPFHRALRAYVRAKVESIRAADPAEGAAGRRRHASAASRLLDLATDYAVRRAPPQVIAMCGPPASGKSTVGATLAARIGAAYLASDALRKELAGIDPRTRAGAAVGAGIYSAESTRRTFAELKRRAHEHLRAGRPVVLDAMHGRVTDRATVRAIAGAHDVPFLIAELRADERTTHARIIGRERDPLRISDAGLDVYRAQRERFQPVQPEEGPHVALDSTHAPGALARQIAASLPT